MEENTTKLPKYKCYCEKHGEINDAYVYRVNMPEYGYNKVSYCLVCAVDYLAMVASEVTYEIDEEKSE